MSAREEISGGSVPASAHFATTHWSVILAAADLETPGAAQALEALCRAYWYPLYAFARRTGRDNEESRDLTQEFFARFLAKHAIAQADRQRGRFRTFLLASFKHLMADEWAKGQRVKRGGGRELVSLDAQEAEERYQNEPSHEITPEKLYDRAWAYKVLDGAVAALREEYNHGGKVEVFDALKPFLTGSDGNMPYLRVASRLGMTEAAVKMAVQRLRTRYGGLVRSSVAETVADAETVEEELRALFDALNG